MAERAITALPGTNPESDAEDPDGREDPMTAPVPPPADGADVAGVTPPTSADGDRPMGATAGPGRTLKLVATLTPTTQGGYQAVLAAGAEGCDPRLQMVAVAGLMDALDALARLTADAEARWQTTPRYPASLVRPTTRAVAAQAIPQPPASSDTARPSTAGTYSSADARNAAGPLAQDAPTHDATPVSHRRGNQLALFT
jgi:hypothetical protein